MRDCPQARLLPDGRRLHLQHGPIDLVVEAWGSRGAVAGAYAAAARRFETVLGELCGELPLLRQPALPGARRMYLTEVDAAPDGDVFMPAFDEAAWREVRRESHPAGPDDDYAFNFRVLERR